MSWPGFNQFSQDEWFRLWINELDWVTILLYEMVWVENSGMGWLLLFQTDLKWKSSIGDEVIPVLSNWFEMKIIRLSTIEFKYFFQMKWSGFRIVGLGWVKFGLGSYWELRLGLNWNFLTCENLLEQFLVYFKKLQFY